MNSDRWRQIDELFQACLEVDGQRRAALLDNASRSDQALREAVEALLASDSGNWSFIEKPALEVGASLLAEEYRQLESGHRVGHYEIVELIGRGGMGEVYLARDQILNRPTALKFLPADYTQDKDRLRRFQREAQAASALNHPNILTIHQLGDVDGQQFIATELVEGETLRARLSRGLLTPAEAVEVAIQVSSALAAAHKAGIVHRDIKPENIMLRPDGYVKVLDFGLAKLAEQYDPVSQTVGADGVDVSSGLLMGTVRYMSPEQARREKVDARSDIFSLGVVLYEMITGLAPLRGETAQNLVKAILKDEPSPLDEYVPDMPEGLQGVLDKALDKNKANRYQTAEDLLVDLKALKQQIGLETGFQRITAPGFGSTRTAQLTKSQGQTEGGEAVSTKPLVLETTSSIGYALSQIRQHKTGAALGLIGLVAVLVGITYPLNKLISKQALPFEKTQVTRLTNTGTAIAGAISRDGNYIAYVVWTAPEWSLWVREMATNRDKQILPPSGSQLTGGQPGGLMQPGGLTFTPDGKYVYYLLREAGRSLAVYRVAMTGGVPEKVLDNVRAGVAFSPDGRQFAFFRSDLSRGVGELAIANADGTGERTVVTRKAPDYFPGGQASWSPNGKAIAYVGINAADGYARVFEVNIESTAQKPLTSQKWYDISSLAWLSDSSGLLLIPYKSMSSSEIWRLSYPSGELQRITNDTMYRVGLSLTADSSSLVTTQFEWLSEIWLAPKGDASRAIRITPGRYDGLYGLSWAPDGKVVYTSAATGNVDIYIMNADGTGQKQLTTDVHNNLRPSVTPDGRYIVFHSDRTGAEHIWRMDIDGRNQKQLTFAAVERFADCTPDSKWVVYNSWETGKATIWKVSIEGGDPLQITDTPCFFPVVSPDGSLIACNSAKGPPYQRLIIPFAGGLPMLSVPSEDGRPPGSGPTSWSSDGRALTYTRTQNNVTNIWLQPIDGSPPRQLTNFNSDQKAASGALNAYAWSADGKQLAFARAENRGDVLLIRDLR